MAVLYITVYIYGTVYMAVLYILFPTCAWCAPRKAVLVPTQSGVGGAAGILACCALTIAACASCKISRYDNIYIYIYIHYTYNIYIYIYIYIYPYVSIYIYIYI